MDANQVISLALLLGRLVNVGIMVLVIKKQLSVLQSKSYPELKGLRRGLLTGSFILILSNIVPIIIDTLGIFGKGSFGLLLAYVFSNNISAMLFAYMLWYNLRLAERIQLIDNKAK